MGVSVFCICDDCESLGAREQTVVGQIMTLKNIHILIPGIYDYVSLHEKRDFADVIKLRILRWGDYSRLSG